MQPLSSVSQECFGFNSEVPLLVRGALLLGPGVSWNFFMMNNFFSMIIVLDIRGTCDIWLLIQVWILHLCMHHAGHEHCLCSGIWFDCKWSTLVYSTFSIDPFELPNSSLMDLQGIPCSNLLKSVQGLMWSVKGSSGSGPKPLTTMPSCMIRVVPLGQMSMSRR